MPRYHHEAWRPVPCYTQTPARTRSNSDAHARRDSDAHLLAPLCRAPPLVVVVVEWRQHHGSCPANGRLTQACGSDGPCARITGSARRDLRRVPSLGYRACAACAAYALSDTKAPPHTGDCRLGSSWRTRHGARRTRRGRAPPSTSHDRQRHRRGVRWRRRGGDRCRLGCCRAARHGDRRHVAARHWALVRRERRRRGSLVRAQPLSLSSSIVGPQRDGAEVLWARRCEV